MTELCPSILCPTRHIRARHTPCEARQVILAQAHPMLVGPGCRPAPDREPIPEVLKNAGRRSRGHDRALRLQLQEGQRRPPRQSRGAQTPHPCLTRWRARWTSLESRPARSASGREAVQAVRITPLSALARPAALSSLVAPCTCRAASCAKRAPFAGPAQSPSLLPRCRSGSEHCAERRERQPVPFPPVTDGSAHFFIPVQISKNSYGTNF